MHKALCAVVLAVVCISTQPLQTAAGGCGRGLLGCKAGSDDAHGWAVEEGVTAREQAEYLDMLMFPKAKGRLEWGGFWSLERQQAKVPLYQFWNASQRHFDAALAGLSPKKKRRLLSDLDTQMDKIWQDMAAIYHLCGTLRESRVETEWEGDEDELIVVYRKGCKSFWKDKRLARAYAFAQAHAGPSTYDGRDPDPLAIFSEMHLRDHFTRGMIILDTTLKFQKVFGTPSSIKMMLMLLAQASEPALRGTPYEQLLLYLDDPFAFLHHVVPETYMDDGIPAWVDAVHAGETPTIQHALVWVAQHTLAILTLEAFHVHTVETNRILGCKNISKWFNDEMLFSSHGLSCMLGSRLKPVSLDQGFHESIEPLVGQLPLSQVPKGYDPDAAEKEGPGAVLVDFDCDGWLECSIASTIHFAKFWFLWVRHVFAPLLGVYLCCWRPDLLVFWSRSRPVVHAPSYWGFVRQVRQQRLLAKAARQAATGKTRGKSKGAAAATGKQDAAVSSKLPEDSGESMFAYAGHLFVHCWCPRARFVVASLAQLSPSSLLAPVRLLVVGRRYVVGVLTGTVRDVAAGTVMAFKRICG